MMSQSDQPQPSSGEQSTQYRTVASPLVLWNDDNLFRGYLAKAKDPILEFDYMEFRARLTLLKIRIRELDKTRALIRPRESPELNQELASLLFKRKILVWVCFPINDLPREIITNIFRFVVWSSRSAIEAIQIRLRLTWTCQLWRHLAINDQTLWNSIWFRDNPPWTRSLAFLERAGTCALDIRINEPEKKANSPALPNLTVEQVDYLMDFLIQRISQLRILVVVLNDWQPAYRIMERFRDVPISRSLERFEIHRSGTPWLWAQPPGLAPIVLCHGELPRLTWLCLSGLSIDWYKLPMSNIRTIDLRRLSDEVCPTPQRWREMLGSIPLLYKLALDSAGPRHFHDIQTLPPVKLPYLRDLLIGDCTLEYANYLLTFFDAPGVINLALVNLQLGDFGPFFDTMLGRYPNIRLMSMYSVKIAPNSHNLVRMIRWLDTIQHLEVLKVSQGCQAFLAALHQNPAPWRMPPRQDSERKDVVSNAIVCPKLKVIHIQNCDPQVVVHLMRERLRMGVPFAKVYIPSAFHSSLDEKTLTSFREAGPSVVVTQAATLMPEEEVIYREMDGSVPSPLSNA